jgi:hypothetical protein
MILNWPVKVCYYLPKTQHYRCESEYQIYLSLDIYGIYLVFLMQQRSSKVCKLKTTYKIYYWRCPVKNTEKYDAIRNNYTNFISEQQNKIKTWNGHGFPLGKRCVCGVRILLILLIYVKQDVLIWSKRFCNMHP